MQVCRWATLGLQGGLLSALVAPLPLTSVVVSMDAAAEAGAMEAAWARAVTQRCHAAYTACAALPAWWTAAEHPPPNSVAVGWSPPCLRTTAVQFQYSQSAVLQAVEAERLQSAADGATTTSSSALREVDRSAGGGDPRPESKRRRKDGDETCTTARTTVVAASPLAMNWHCRAAEQGAASSRRRSSGGAEVTVGATGLRHGVTAKNRSKAGSRLCRVALHAAVKAALGSAASPATGAAQQGRVGGAGATAVDAAAVTAKAPHEAHCAALAAFKASTPFVGWEGVTQRKLAALLGELRP
jgi:hypothetical protein